MFLSGFRVQGKRILTKVEKVTWIFFISSMEVKKIAWCLTMGLWPFAGWLEKSLLLLGRLHLSRWSSQLDWTTVVTWMVEVQQPQGCL
jgi:hypothetical protein